MAQITAAIVLAMAAGVMPLAGQTSLSIYSDGRVVVRRTLPQALQKGRNSFTLKVEGLDGATLFSPDTAVAVVSAVVRPPTDHGAALTAAAGQALSFVRARAGGGADTVRATVVRSDPPQYRLPDGRYLLSQPGLRRLLFQEWMRFGWYFVVSRRDPAGLWEWIRLRRMGRRENFRRPGQ